MNKSRIKWGWFGLFGLVLLIISTLIIVGRFSNDFIADVTSRANEAGAPPLTRDYELAEGWTFISFPMKPGGFNTASQMLDNIIKAGGYVTTIAAWKDEAWSEYNRRGVDEFGEDFVIEPGVAYFVRNHKPVNWKVNLLALRMPQKQDFKPGWNGVGVLGALDTASAVIDAINQLEHVAIEIDRWLGGTWDPFVKPKTDKPADTTTPVFYGTNFPILDTEGYMIRLESNQ